MRCAFKIAAFLAVFLAIVSFGNVARANWQFAQWGMTPEQLVAASGGSAHLLALDKRTSDGAGHWQIVAEGSATVGGVKVSTGFMFDTAGGGLICVLYNASGTNAKRLLDFALAQFGHPASDKSFGVTRDITWQTPDSIELAINQEPQAAAVTHCAPGR